ncbi:MAG TPA: cytochrome c oxidase subunit II [Acidimicrobiales bacterium]|nr:cytochrome c oxidase subunit II [Acidimicrobiales bacterium]
MSSEATVETAQGDGAGGTGEAGAADIPKPFFSRPGGKIFIIWLILTAIGIVLAFVLPKHTFPTMLTKEGSTGVTTVIFFTIMAAPVAALVYGIAAYSLLAWRHRGHPDEPPEDGPPLRGNAPVTIVWLVVTSLLCIVLLVWGLAAMAADNQSPPGALRVDVTGQQWLWTFSYPGTGVSSRSLVLPLNRPVRFDVTSEDVTHGFWSMSLGVQVDANPDVVTTIYATPNKLGTFTVQCSQLCGLYHAFMYAPGSVVTPHQFALWLFGHGATLRAASLDAKVKMATGQGGSG